MSTSAAVDAHAGPSQPAVRLPPGPRIPKVLVAILFAVSRQRMTRWLARRYGTAFTLNSPIFGRGVIVTDPDLAKQVFLASPEDLGNIQPNLSRVLGPGSVFALDGAEHRRRRNLLGPPFHGKSVRAYEQVVVEETLREIANWPAGSQFQTLRPMMRITLNVILRAVFGAQGAELDELRRLLPRSVTLGSRLVTLPMPSRTYGRFSPWGRLAEWRRRYEEILDKVIEDVRTDPNFDDRTDVLSLLLRSRYDDGTVMSRGEIGDELLTFLAAGHETTASTLAWVFERITRYPDLLAALAAEAETDENTLRRATIREVQRSRTVIDFCGRHVYAPTITLGEWVIPRGYTVMVSIAQIHQNSDFFENPDRFDPQRYVTGNPPTFAWIPFGGGTRRCPGSAFANLEMDMVLRTVLRNFVIEPTTDPDEKWHARGVAFTPKDGGLIVVHPR
ncbi:MAG TPA: cytochrome P450 [Mycobacterium sp.]